MVALPPVNTVPLNSTLGVDAAPAPLNVVSPLAVSVVNAPLPGVVPPIAPGDAKVAPLRLEAFRLATLVVLATTNGAVPVASVDVICPVALSVVNAPVDGVVDLPDARP